MLLRDFKKEHGYTAAGLAKLFNTTRPNINYYMSKGAEVKGRPGRREIVLNTQKVMAEEAQNNE